MLEPPARYLIRLGAAKEEIRLFWSCSMVSISPNTYYYTGVFTRSFNRPPSFVRVFEHFRRSCPPPMLYIILHPLQTEVPSN